jgi:hypothetical protein
VQNDYFTNTGEKAHGFFINHNRDFGVGGVVRIKSMDFAVVWHTYLHGRQLLAYAAPGILSAGKPVARYGQVSIPN